MEETHSLIAGAAKRSIVALVVAVVLGVGALPVITGSGVPVWDASNFYAPALSLVGDSARAGRLLLWNPFTSGGSPDSVDPQVGAFSPLTILIAWAFPDPLSAFVWYWMALWWLGGIGMGLLAQQLGAPRWAAAIAAIAFVSSGFYAGHAQHTSILTAMSALPWSLWRLELSMERRRFLEAAQAGAIIGLGGLAGYPGVTIVNGVVLCLWMVGRALLVERSTSEPETSSIPIRARCLGALAIAGIVAILTVSPTYWSFFVEGDGYSDRAGPLTRETAVESNALHPASLASVSTAYFPVLRSLNRKLDWFYTSPSSGSIYLVTSILILGLIAPLSRPRDPWRWYLLALAILFLCASMGRALPIRGWLYDLFLPFRYFRHSSVLRGHSLFFIVVLAAIGTRDLVQNGESRRKALKIASWLSFAFALLSIIAIQALPEVFERTGRPWQWARMVSSAVWISTFLAFVVSRWMKRFPVVLPAFMLILAMVDGTTSLRMASPVMYSPRVQDWEEIRSRYRGEVRLQAEGFERFLESDFGRGRNNHNIVSKEPVFSSYTPFRNHIQQRWIVKPILLQAVLGRDRIWFSRATTKVPTSQSCFESYARHSRRMGGPLLVIHDDDDDCSFERLTPAQRIPVEIQTYEPGLLELEVDSDESGWLWLTERFAKGWQAEINGQAIQPQRANFVFLAVEIPQGRSRLSLRYSPAGYPWLVIMSWSLLGALLVLLPLVGMVRTPRISQDLAGEDR